MDFERVSTYFYLGMWVFIGAGLKIVHSVLVEAKYIQVFPEVSKSLILKKSDHSFVS